MPSAVNAPILNTSRIVAVVMAIVADRIAAVIEAAAIEVTIVDIAAVAVAVGVEAGVEAVVAAADAAMAEAMAVHAGQAFRFQRSTLISPVSATKSSAWPPKFTPCSAQATTKQLT